MAHHKKSDSPYLYDNATGDIVGIQDPDGSEQLFPNFSQTFTLDPTAGLQIGGAAPNAEQRAAVRAGIGANLKIRGGRCAAIGDSVTAVGVASWFHQMCIYSGGKLRRAYNAGVSGDDTSEMATRIATAVPSSLNVTTFFITGGTNDPGASISHSKTMQNIVGMAQYAQLIGSDPVLVKPPPKNTTTAELTAIRAGYDEIASLLGLICIDPWVNFVDTATGGWISGSATDGTHPTEATAREAGAEAFAQLNSYISPVWNGLSSISGMTGAIITTGEFFPDTDSDGRPDGWLGTTSNGLVGVNTIAQNKYWNAWKISTSGMNGSAVAVAGDLIEQRTISSLTLAEGTRLAIAARVSLAGAASGITAYININTSGVTDQSPALDKYNFSGDLNDAIVWGEFVVGAGGVTSVRAQIRLVTRAATPGVGYVEVSDLQVWNLTAMGIV